MTIQEFRSFPIGTIFIWQGSKGKWYVSEEHVSVEHTRMRCLQTGEAWDHRSLESDRWEVP